MGERHLRLLDGKYLTIGSGKKGNKVVPVEAERIEGFETVWKQLGSRAIDHTSSRASPHRIGYVSQAFRDALCEYDAEMFE